MDQLGRLALSILALMYVLTTRASTEFTPPDAPQASMQKGVSYAAWWSGDYRKPGADLSLEWLASTGATWIALIVTGYQETHTATTIDFRSERTPTDVDLIHVIRQAHALGLKVMLKPHLDLPKEWESEFWRGDVGTAFTTEAQWSAWFASYGDFVGHYASLAQAHGVDQFCVGTELLGTSSREADWRQVIDDVRDLYKGPIVYAAQHHEEATRIPWWDAVDYIGVNAYYALADDPGHHPGVEELEAAWQEPRGILANLAAARGKQILITEIGYRSHHGCSCHPWDSWAVSPVDLEEQAFAYEAALRQLYDQPWLAGIYWWTWYPDRFRSGPCDDSFSPHLKPAEDVLRAWYGGPPLPKPPVLVADYDQARDIYSDGLAAGWEDWSWEATIDQGATEAVNSGSRSISVTLGPWGGFSLWHPPFETDAYHWLEFYVRGVSERQPVLVVFLDTEDGTRLPPVPVNDCRHIEGGIIETDKWKRVRLPLSDLNVPGLEWFRLSIQNTSGHDPASFWLDDVRLVAARAPSVQVFLPVVSQGR
jgi:hypothetical protein